MKKKTSGIYLLTSPSGKLYVGQSRNIEKRIKDYKSHDCLTQRKLYFSFEKYGFENHKFEILEECSVEMLNEREIYWINHFQTFNTEHGLNLTSGGSNPNVSEETRKLHSEISKADCYFMRMTPEHIAENTKRIREQHLKRKGSKHTEESKKKMSESQTGKKRTEEQNKKQSERMKGTEKNFSPEHREFLRNQMKELAKQNIGRKQTPEHIESVKKAKEGKPMTDEHKEKLRQVNKNRIWTEEDRRAVSQRNTGIVHSEESRKKQSELMKEKHRFKKELKQHQLLSIQNRYHILQNWDQLQQSISAF